MCQAKKSQHFGGGLKAVIHPLYMVLQCTGAPASTNTGASIGHYDTFKMAPLN